MADVRINAAGGIRNDVSSERLEKTDLTSGYNIDIDQTGRVSRRRGTVLHTAGVTYSLWSDGKQAFYVRSSTIYQLFPDLTSRAVQAGVSTDVVFESIDDTVYWTDGRQSGEIRHGQNRQWGVPVPEAPSLASTYGDMPAGLYGVTVVNLRDDQESGAPRGEFIQLEANSGIQISGLPLTPTRIYITTPDGEQFYAAGDYVGFASVAIRGLPPSILPLRTQFMGPAPAGQVLGEHSGRMYIGSGNVLWYSEPIEYGLFRYTNFMQFEDPITIFASVKDGAFVATQKETYFLEGSDPAKYELVPVAGFGGVRGTLTYPRNDLLTKEGVQGVGAMWTSSEGVMLGTTGGQLLNLTGNRYVMPDATQGAGLFKLRSGTPQYVTTLYR